MYNWQTEITGTGNRSQVFFSQGSYIFLYFDIFRHDMGLEVFLSFSHNFLLCYCAVDSVRHFADCRTVRLCIHHRYSYHHRRLPPPSTAAKVAKQLLCTCIDGRYRWLGSVVVRASDL